MHTTHLADKNNRNHKKSQVVSSRPAPTARAYNM